MKLLNVLPAVLLAVGIMTLAARAEEGSKNEELRKALKDFDRDGSWIYDDLDAGFAAARKSSRPLLVVFR